MRKPTEHKECVKCGSKILFAKGMCRTCYYRDYNAKKKKKK
jgi:NMD protein affecting ribosome stability and mRNA decay